MLFFAILSIKMTDGLDKMQVMRNKKVNLCFIICLSEEKSVISRRFSKRRNKA
jgi:hypothetical protein